MTRDDAVRLLDDADDDNGIPESVAMHVLSLFADQEAESECLP